ncbi:2-polyprenyl-6-methoxyphenol hydroxylase [Chryseobacterium sp. FH2]|uniref:FAD-dependent oxidoreductase n=1 Tax=Chryseobacterium sp. FH2 TaxID=1674291 RepID=UPI00065B0181|nr:NAD(P)/FAD-dependent oxidoreductase [Chryseobacterium sp. FH2]KMQ68809.1 2-polyprenyl-6-methoxyphenol hydroxylase [Chryseobacterium sp. FH2]
MLLQNKKVAIIGGGPGGLTLARLLQQKEIDVKVYERDLNRNVRTQGATLDLHENSGLKALKTANLLDAFKSTYRPGAEKGRVLDKMGYIIFDEHEKAFSEIDFDSPDARPEIDRSDLRDLLLNSLAPDTVLWDSQFVNMTPAGSQWEIKFKDGKTVLADLVIGADGGNSKIRPFVTSIQSSYAGITILQGNVDDAKTKAPRVNELLQGGKIYVHNGGKYLHISAKGDGSIDFYISSKRDETWTKDNGINFSDRTQLIKWFKTEFVEWGSIWFELFENVDLPMLVRPQYSIPLDQSWIAKSNITLLGDAAHIMAPSGEGVNLAMLDALELSECLTNEDFIDVQNAIAAYEAPMRERAAQEAAESFEMIEWMHGEDAQERMLAFFNNADEQNDC